MIRCMVVDDEELARELLEKHISRVPSLELVASCANAIEAHQVLRTRTIDLIFLDIEMPLLKGTDFIKNLHEKPQVIFTTAHRDYALQGFELNAVDYLLKPIVFERFFQAIEKFFTLSSGGSKLDNLTKEYIFVKRNKKNIKLLLQDILYIESQKDYVKIVKHDEQFLIKTSLSAFHNQLDNRFLRIHRSYIINTEKVTAFTKADVEIDDIEIPIGEQYKESVSKEFEEKL
ncbi:LytR/AlgR family response regulator transcription factor [Fulvivirga ligni]|uniref:LytR/AlgR family response regulator transcription factor n=1 Tax=Fulvivirga ligni TaxID=2904246 RepID=UPI001F297BE1|nr:LytTR family DNA-binding domain-containing protein [Fulvivirga ligni]UII23048.1 LytTR family DNA-binding domain-containing protein [Fulvivirga ligni]